MRLAIEWGSGGRPELVIGTRGGHGGPPDAIRFPRGAALDCVSCSPPRDDETLSDECIPVEETPR